MLLFLSYGDLKFRFTAPYIKAINILSAYAILTSIRLIFKIDNLVVTLEDNKVD